MRVMQALTLIAATALYISLLLAVPVAAAVEKRNSSEEYKKLPCYWNLPQSTPFNNPSRDECYFHFGDAILIGSRPNWFAASPYRCFDSRHDISQWRHYRRDSPRQRRESSALQW